MANKKPTKKLSVKEIHEQNQHVKRPVETKWYADAIGLAIISMLGIIIYSNSFHCSFHFDDSFNIVDNTAIRNLSDVKAWWNYNHSRPIAFMSFALNYHFNQLDVWYWHLVNLAIHLINSCLVYCITILIISSPALKDTPISNHKKTFAFVTALLFVSHPLATQSVTYIVQRMASMVAMFYLISIALYIKARLIGKSNLSKIALFTGSFLAAILAMYTKENAFTLPFAILLVEIFFLQTKSLFINFKDYRIILLSLSFLIITLIALLKFPFSILKPIPPDEVTDFRTVTSLNYLLTQFSVIVKYIWLLILPVNLNFDHDFQLSNSLFELRTLLSFILLLSLVIFGVFFFKRNRIISFGIFWFFLTLSIESSIIPINDLSFEHRTYLPSFGFFLILSAGIYELLINKYKYVAYSLFFVIILSNSFLTFQRNTIWKDDFTLWNDVISKSPNKARGYNNRGIAFNREEKHELAIKDYDRAIELQPKHDKAYINRGIALFEEKKYDLALNDFNKAIELQPKFAKAYFKRGTVFNIQEKYELALNDFNKAIELQPQYFDAYNNRGNVYTKIEKYEQALNDFTMVIKLQPQSTKGYFNRGLTFEKTAQIDKAILDYSTAIDIDPKFAQAYFKRGLAFNNQGKWTNAISDYSTAIGIDPKFIQAYSNRGIAYGNLGQWEKAIADFSKAIEIDPNFTAAISNRDIAYNKLRNAKK